MTGLLDIIREYIFKIWTALCNFLAGQTRRDNHCSGLDVLETSHANTLCCDGIVQTDGSSFLRGITEDNTVSLHDLKWQSKDMCVFSCLVK